MAESEAAFTPIEEVSDTEAAFTPVEEVKPERKPEDYSVGEKAANTLRALYGGSKQGLVTEAPAQLGEMIQAGRPVHEGEETWADRKAKEAEAARAEQAKDTSPTLFDSSTGQMANEIAGNFPQIITNLGGMAAGAVAGAETGAVGGIPGAVVGGVLGAAASLVPTFFQGETAAAKQNLAGLEAKRKAEGKAPMTMPEKLAEQEAMQGDVAKQSAANVVTEVPGIALETLPIVGPWAKVGAGKLIRSGLSKAALKEFGAGAAKAGATTMATEPLEETVSQIATRDIENKYQQDQKPSLSFTNPEDYLTAYKEVVGPTLRGMLPMTLMAMVGGGTGRYHGGRQLADIHDQLQKADPAQTVNIDELNGIVQGGKRLIDSGALEGTDDTWVKDKVAAATANLDKQKQAQLESFIAFDPESANLTGLAVAGDQGGSLVRNGFMPKVYLPQAIGKIKAIKAASLKAFNTMDVATANAGDAFSAVNIGTSLIKSKAFGKNDAAARKKVADAGTRLNEIVKAKQGNVLTEAAKVATGAVTPSVTPEVGVLPEVKVEPTKVEPTKVEPTKVEPTAIEPTKVEPTKVEPTAIEPTKVEPTAIEPTKVEPTKVEPTAIEPTKVEPTKVEPTKVEPTKVEPTKVEPTAIEPTKVEPTKVEPTAIEPTKVEPTKVEPTPTEVVEEGKEVAWTDTDIADLKARAKKMYVEGELEIPQYMFTLDLMAKQEYDSADKIVKAAEANFAQSNLPLAKGKENKMIGKVDIARLMDMIGQNMYSANLADVTIKEMIQNSFDAARASVAQKKEKIGKIDVIVDPSNRYIIIRDNGQGMTPKIIQDAFLTIAGTNKEGLAAGESGGGGFGMAKAAFLIGNERIWVRTSKQGKRTTFTANGSEIFSSEINPMIEAVDKDEHGTTIIVKVPSTVNVNGEDRYVWFPSRQQDVEFFKNPLLNDKIEFRFSEHYFYSEDPINVLDKDDAGIWGGVEYETLPLGVHADMSDFVLNTTAKTEWGDIDVYIGKKRKGDRETKKHSVLSSGVFQFPHSFSINFQQIPYDIIVNVRPKVAANSPLYPFNLKREGWNSQVKEDIQALTSYVSNVAQGLDAESTVETFKTIRALPKIDVDKSGSSANVDITSFIIDKPKPKAEVPEGKTAIFSPPTVTVGGGKVTGVDSKGNEATYVDTKAEKGAEKYGKSFDPNKEIKTAKDYLLDVGIDDNLPIFHNNTSIDYADINPVSDVFFAEVGSVFLGLRDRVAALKRWGYEPLERKAGASYFVGISLDKGYHGVSINIPFKAAMLNPLAVKGDTLQSIVYGMYDTMVHEFTHIPVRSHNENFTMEYHDLAAALARDGTDIEMRVQLGRIFKKHKGLFNELRDKFNESTTKNIAKSIHEGEGNTGTASRRLENGSFTSNTGELGEASGIVQGEREDSISGRIPSDAGLSKPSGERTGATELSHVKKLTALRKLPEKVLSRAKIGDATAQEVLGKAETYQKLYSDLLNCYRK
jgi:hypothetical protein